MLAVLVLLTIGSVLGYDDYISIAWPEVGKGNPILAFALSVGHLLHNALGLTVAFATVAGILIVEGFLITTLDSAVRLNRYLFEELWKSVFVDPPLLLRKFWFNSGLSVILMLLLAWNQGYKLIWPLFGSTNQLLAALTLIALTVWLHHAGRKSWFTLIPAVIMFITTVGSLIYNLFVKYIPQHNLILATTDIILLALSVGVTVLSLRQLLHSKVKLHSEMSS